MSSVPSLGKVPSVLACWALCTLPVLCCGPHGWVQYASVHPERVQSHRRQGRFSSLKPCCCCVRQQQQENGYSSAPFNWKGHQGHLRLYFSHRVCLHWQSSFLIACTGSFFFCLFSVFMALNIHAPTISGMWIWNVHWPHRAESWLLWKEEEVVWIWLAMTESRTAASIDDVQYASLHKFIPKMCHLI